MPAGPPTSGEVAERVGCPVLVQVCEYDIYHGEWFERAVADQLEFFTRHLL